MALAWVEPSDHDENRICFRKSQCMPDRAAGISRYRKAPSINSVMNDGDLACSVRVFCC